MALPLIPLLGLGAAGLGGWIGTKIGNAVNTIRDNYVKSQVGTPVQLTPYAQQRATELGGWGNVDYLARQRLASLNKNTTTNKTPTTTGGGGGGYSSYSSGGGGGYIPSYEEAFNKGKSAVSSYYQPYKDYLKKEQGNTYKRYQGYANTQEKNIPLIQQRYKALLDALAASTATQRTDINEQEAAQLGRQQARAATRGTYGSSAMEGGEQMISKAAMGALSDLAAQERAKTQELSAAQGLEEESIYDKMRQILLQGEDRGADIMDRLLGLAPQELSGALQYGGGVVDTAAKNADLSLQRYLASLRGSEATKGNYQEIYDPVSGTNKIAYVVNGQVQNYLGQSPQTGAEAVYGQVQREIASKMTDGYLTQEDKNDLLYRYPQAADMITNLPVATKQPWYKTMFGSPNYIVQ